MTIAALIVAMLALPSVVATNLAAIALRDDLAGRPAPPISLEAVVTWSRVRSDLKARITERIGSRDSMPLPAADGVPFVPAGRDVHWFSTALLRRDWVWVADRAAVVPEAELRWRQRTPVPPSALAAIMQRAAEILAETDPVRAERYGAKARRALAGQTLVADPGNLHVRQNAGHLVAAELEQVRLANAAPTPVGLTNGDFTLWAAAEGIVPGWAAAQADAEFRLIKHAAPALEVCAVAGQPATVITNTGFRSEPGAVYRLAATVQGTGNAVATVGVRFLDPATTTTVGVYPVSGPVSTEPVHRELTWRAPPDSHAEFVVGVSSQVGRSCVLVRSATAKRLIGQ